MTRRDEKRHQADTDYCAGGSRPDMYAGVRGSSSVGGLAPLEQCVADYKDGKGPMPESFQPGAGLRAGSDRTAARQQTGEGQHMR
jgi:hypothetical protein